MFKLQKEMQIEAVAVMVAENVEFLLCFLYFKYFIKMLAVLYYFNLNIWNIWAYIYNPLSI